MKNERYGKKKCVLYGGIKKKVYLCSEKTE